MNYRSFAGLLLLLGAIGCASNNTAQAPNVVEPSEPAAVVTEAPTTSSSDLETTEASPIAPDDLDSATVDRDYAPTSQGR